MGTRVKVGLLVVAVVANVVAFWWRLSHVHQPLPVGAVNPVVLGEKQAAAILEWKQARKVPLTTDGIADYVGQLGGSGCVEAPPNVEIVPVAVLSDAQREDLKRTIQGLVVAYASGAPEELLGYMADRGQQLSPYMVDELKRLLVTDGGYSESRLASLESRDVFLTFTDEVGYATHWSQLIGDTACTVVWRKPNFVSSSNANRLGRDAAGLFKNQTRFNHLFVDADAELAQGVVASYQLYADFRFVVEHDIEMLRESSPYYVRFGYNRRLSKWQPVEMIHVATSSGNSPILLF